MEGAVLDAPQKGANTKLRSFAEKMSEYEGQKILICAARFHYRGRVAEVLEDSIVLADACVIEMVGEAKNARPNQEDALLGDLCLKFDAIEVVYQAPCSQAPLPSEDDYQASS